MNTTPRKCRRPATELELTQKLADRAIDRVAELRAIVDEKDAEIAQLRARLARTRPAAPSQLRKVG